MEKAFLELPLEVLANIFSYLDLLDLITVSEVCRYLKSVTDEDVLLWKNLAHRRKLRPFLVSLTLHDNLSCIDQPASFWRTMLKTYFMLHHSSCLQKWLEPVQNEARDAQLETITRDSNVEIGVVCGIEYSATLIQTSFDERKLQLRTLNWTRDFKFPGKAILNRFNFCFLSEHPVLNKNQDLVTFLLVSFQYRSSLVLLQWIDFTSDLVLKENCCSFETEGGRYVTNRPEILTRNNIVVMKLSQKLESFALIFKYDQSQFVRLQTLNFDYLVHTIMFLESWRSLLVADSRGSLTLYKSESNTFHWSRSKSIMGLEKGFSDCFDCFFVDAHFLCFFNVFKSWFYLLDLEANLDQICSQITKEQDPQSERNLQIEKLQVFNFVPYKKTSSVCRFQHLEEVSIKVDLIGKRTQISDRIQACFTSLLVGRSRQIKDMFEAFVDTLHDDHSLYRNSIGVSWDNCDGYDFSSADITLKLTLFSTMTQQKKISALRFNPTTLV